MIESKFKVGDIFFSGKKLYKVIAITNLAYKLRALCNNSIFPYKIKSLDDIKHIRLATKLEKALL